MSMRTAVALLLSMLTVAGAAPRGGGSPRAGRQAPPRDSGTARRATSQLALPAVEPSRPATTWVAYLKQADQGAALLFAARAAEVAAARVAEPRAAARGYLAAALAAAVAGERGATRRSAQAARQRAQRAGDAEAEAFALLLMGGQAAEAAARLYAAARNAEGQQLARALRLRSLVQPTRGGDGQLAQQLETLFVELEAGPRIPLADLNAAGAAELFAERLRGLGKRLDARLPGDPKLWFARAERLASGAAAPADGSVVSVAAANLAATARLQPYLDEAAALPADWANRFGGYVAQMTQTLAAADDPVVLTIGVGGLLANYDLNHRILRRLPDAEPANRAAKAMLGLTVASLPLTERPPLATAAVEAALGLPGHGPAHEVGRSACQALARALGNVQPDEDPAMESYLDYAFWFYERTKATALSRLLARLLNEERLPAEAQRRKLALETERAKLAVELLQSALTNRGRGAAAKSPASASDFARYQQVRRELITIELGNDDEARAAAAVLERRFTGTEAQRSLPNPDSAILAYGLDWGFVVTPRAVRWFEPAAPSWRQVAEQVAAVGDPEVAEATRIAAARELYDAYVRPVLADLDGASSLILVPDGPLACLPFEALVSGTSVQDGALPGSWREARFLGDRFAIEYIPSLTMMAISRSRGRGLIRRVPKAALAVGDVTLPSEVEVGDDATRFVFVPTRSGAENELLALPHTGEEARQVVATVGPAQSTLLLGDAASRAAVEAALPQHRILHFATHGVLADESDPLGSALLLSPNADGSPGLLTARDVYGLRLPANLAVLSACDTARGAARMVSGGVTSLAGAFLYAGVPAVVASLWPVDDEATARFMEAFYPAVRGDSPRDEVRALQAAKSALRGTEGGKWADPYYWAPFLIFR